MPPPEQGLTARQRNFVHAARPNASPGGSINTPYSRDTDGDIQMQTITPSMSPIEVPLSIKHELKRYDLRKKKNH